MEYFMEFHWWYVLVGLVLLMMFNGKGGFVVKGYTANLMILDDRFVNCVPTAKYSIFKEGQPDKIDIDIEELSLPVGDEMELLLNGKRFASIEVERDMEAEFEYWSDEDVEFPVIKEGDELVVIYQGTEVLKGTFALDK